MTQRCMTVDQCILPTFPPMNISEVYSSIALFESDTYGTYL